MPIVYQILKVSFLIKNHHSKLNTTQLLYEEGTGLGEIRTEFRPALSEMLIRYDRIELNAARQWCIEHHCLGKVGLLNDSLSLFVEVEHEFEFHPAVECAAGRALVAGYGARIAKTLGLHSLRLDTLRDQVIVARLGASL